MEVVYKLFFSSQIRLHATALKDLGFSSLPYILTIYGLMSYYKYKNLNGFNSQRGNRNRNVNTYIKNIF